MPNLRPTELIIILLIIVLLFGAKKLPETARGIGRSLRIFKAETKGLRDDDTTESAPPSAAPQQIAPPPSPQQGASSVTQPGEEQRASRPHDA